MKRLLLLSLLVFFSFKFFGQNNVFYDKASKGIKDAVWALDSSWRSVGYDTINPDELYRYYVTSRNDDGQILTATEYKLNPETNEKTPYFCEQRTYKDGKQLTLLRRPWFSSLQDFSEDTMLFYQAFLPNARIVSVYKSYDDQENIISGSKTIFYTNNDTNVTARITQFWDFTNNDWENFWYENFYYDENQRDTLWQRKNWNSETRQWENSIAQVYTYDNYGNQNSFLYKEWKKDHWQNKYYYTRKFDDMGKKLEEVYQEWDTISNTWANTNKYVWNYLGEHLLSYYNYIWHQGDWYNYFKTIYEYNSDSLLITETNWWWSPDSLVWYPTDRYVYVYNDKNQLVCKRKELLLGHWTYSQRDTLIYDTYGFLDSTITQIWDDIDSLWENQTLSINLYRPDGTVYLTSSQSWSTNTNSWQVDFYQEILKDKYGNIIFNKHYSWFTKQWTREEFFFSLYGGSTGISDIQVSGIQVYPNPANSYICINTGNDEKAQNIEICDINGKVVKMTNWKDKIDISDLQQGIYILKVGNKSGVFIKQ